MSLNSDRIARDNLSQEDSLKQKMLSLEAQTLTWMAEATTLHGAVDAGDKAQVLALRDDLIARLTAAVSIP